MTVDLNKFRLWEKKIFPKMAFAVEEIVNNDGRDSDLKVTIAIAIAFSM
jgi:hypothetical protein